MECTHSCRRYSLKLIKKFVKLYKIDNNVGPCDVLLYEENEENEAGLFYFLFILWSINPSLEHAGSKRDLDLDTKSWLIYPHNLFVSFLIS